MNQAKLLFLLFLQAKPIQGCGYANACAGDGTGTYDVQTATGYYCTNCWGTDTTYTCTNANCDCWGDGTGYTCNDRWGGAAGYYCTGGTYCTGPTEPTPTSAPTPTPTPAPTTTPTPAPTPALTSSSAKTTGDPHTLGLHGDRFDAKGKNNTVYCTFSSRDLHANVLFMYDTFLMGGTCANCMTKVVQGSFMKEIFLVANTAANTTLNIFFSAMSPSLAKYSIPHHRLLPDGELKVSAVLPSKDEFIADNVQVQLERVSARESHLMVKNDEYKIVAKSRMYPWADRNLKRKRLDLTISFVMDEKLIPVAPHGLIGQTFDKDDIAVDGKLDDYTGSKIDGHTSVVVTKAMGEGAIEGVLAEYEINRASPFSTAFKYSRFGLTMADPRNISALSGTKRKIIKVKGIPGSASAVHDITDAMAETSAAA